MLDQLFAEPIVQQLMRRDRIDEATTRRLLQHMAAARAARPKLRAEGDTNAIVRLPQQAARVLLRRIGIGSIDKLISALTKLKKNLTCHKAGPVQRSDYD
jgi:hypothetical protein